jgi:hypothetical protein
MYLDLASMTVFVLQQQQPKFRDGEWSAPVRSHLVDARPRRATPHTIQDKFLMGYHGWSVSHRSDRTPPRVASYMSTRYTCPGDGASIFPGRLNLCMDITTRSDLLLEPGRRGWSHWFNRKTQHRSVARSI